MVQDEIEYKIEEIKGLLSGRSPVNIKNLLTQPPPNTDIKVKSHSCTRKHNNDDLFEESPSPPTQD